MRIAIFTETYLPQINGVVTHIKILKEGLEALGHTVLIVTADSKAHTHYLKDNVLHCPAHNLKRIYNLDLASPVSRTRLKYLREFRPDIIHVHNEFSIGLSGMAIAKILKVPLVYTLHTMYDDYIYYIAPKPLIPLTKKLSHRYFRMFPQNAAVPPAFLPHCTCPSQVSFLYQSKQKDASDFGRSVFLLSSSFSVILPKKLSFLSPVFTITT